MHHPVLRELRTDARILKAVGGLHYMKGNAAPYFSLTCEEYVRRGTRDVWDEGSFGAAHDLLLQGWPELAPLVALHLSDLDGVPMHAETNGWYWLAGACGGLGEQYHGGNGWPYSQILPECRPQKCTEKLARHLRVSHDEADTLVRLAQANYAACLALGYSEKKAREKTRTEFAAFVDEQRPRWKREADDAIEQFGLVVYGDPWPSLVG